MISSKKKLKNMSFLKNKIIAHRGVHINAAENSLEAFKLALKKEYIIEFDVHLLKDNTIVVFHDDNLKRMTGIDKDLKDCTYDEIKSLKLLNTNSYIPTLDEVLKLIDGKVPIIIELKYDRKVGLLEKEVVKRLDNYKGKFCVKSFSPMVVRWFKKNKPNYIRGLLLSSKKDSFREKFAHTSFVFKMCKPDFISCSYRLYNNKKIKKYISRMPVLAWTIRNDKNYEKYKNIFYNLIIDIYKNKED